MAGGDGSQAIVAAIAAEHDLPYACIPAGTRNHFALDLGVDRDDVVGALDAFVDGGERAVDLAEVNGRVFVNNVSLGALRRGGPARGLPRREAAHAARHRARRARPGAARQLDLRWTGPGGHEHQRGRRGARLQQPLPARAARSARARARGSTTACSGSRSSARRPGAARGGRGPAAPWREWSAPRFEVDSDGRVPAGDRRRGARARPAAALPHPARRAARADRARAPRRLAVGDGSRGPRGGRASSWRASPSAAIRTPQPQPRGGPNGPDGDHGEGAAAAARRPPPACTPSPTRWPGTTTSSSSAAGCASRCTCPTRSTSSSRSRSTTTRASSRSSSNGDRTAHARDARSRARRPCLEAPVLTAPIRQEGNTW